MNKVIYLEIDEEIINVIDRLKEAKEKKIALVIPAGAILLGSSVNLRLLFEEGQKIGKEISIVTADTAGGNIASQIGFTVYENLSDAREIKERGQDEEDKKASKRKKEEEREDEEDLDDSETVEEEDEADEDEELVNEDSGSRQKTHAHGSIFDEEDGEIEDPKPKMVGKAFVTESRRKKKSGIKVTPKAWLLIGCAFLVVLFLLVFIFPKATVYLNVYASEEDINVGFSLSADTNETNGNVLPASWESSEKEISSEMSTTGKKNIGDKAGGIVVVYNRSGKTVNIAAGTNFLTSDNKKFILPQAASVSGAVVSEFGEMVPGKASVTIEASEGGTEYNVKAGRFYIPILAEMLGNLVYAQSEEAFVNGTDKEARVASPEDIENVKNKARDEAEKKLEEEFGMRGERLFVKGLGTQEIVSEVVDKKEWEEGDKIKATVKIRFSFLVFSKNDFDKMFEEALKIQLSNQKELVGKGYRSVSWEVKEFDEKDKKADLIARAMVLTAASINKDFLKDKIISLDVPELRAALSVYPEVELDRVRFFPPLLVSSIPGNEKNVEIVIKYTER